MQSDWYARARAILNRDWDPIRLSRATALDAECWADEYVDYLDFLVLLIRNGAPDVELVAYLIWAEVEFIGLPPADLEKNYRVVAALRALGRPPV